MWENANMDLSLLLNVNIQLKCLHNFETTGIFKISSYGNFVTTFACLILASNYNSTRTLSVKVLTLPVPTQPNLHAIKHL